MLALLLLSIVPYETIVEDQVGLIEVNLLHDDEGKLTLTQAIFYDWKPRKGRHEVAAWKLVKSPAMWPRRDHVRGDWVCRWVDEQGRNRAVRAPTWRETYTQFDPELLDREHLPVGERRGLLGDQKPITLDRRGTP